MIQGKDSDILLNEQILVNIIYPVKFQEIETII